MKESRSAGLRSAFRESGLRCTPQRLEIYRLLREATDHPAAESLHDALVGRMPTVSRDTVYRTLAVLEEAGLVRKIYTLDGRCRYEPDPRPHHHFICTKCNRIQDFVWHEFDRLTPPGPTRSLGNVHMQCAQLVGVCDVRAGKGVGK